MLVRLSQDSLVYSDFFQVAMCGGDCGEVERCLYVFNSDAVYLKIDTRRGMGGV